MKLRPMTWGRWVVLLGGVLPATISTFQTGLKTWVLATGFLLKALSSPSSSVFSLLVVQLGLGFMITLEIALLICLWLLILFGPEQIKRHLALHKVVVVAVVLGLAEITLWLVRSNWRVYSARDLIVSAKIFIIPMAVGLWYLPRLIKGAKK